MTGPVIQTRHPTRIIDCHHHVGQLALGMSGEAVFETAPASAAAQVHAAMLDRFGLAAACVLPGLQYERPHGIVNTRDLNTGMAAYRDSLPSRFPVAFGTVEPLHGLELCREEIGRIADELKLDGLTWHTRYQGVALSDRRMHALLDMAAEFDLPCFLHVFYESAMEAPWMVADLAKNHPETTLVVLDGFSGNTQIQYVMDLADRFERLLFDTAICFPLLRPLDRFVERFGSQRLIFGTDSYADPVSYNSPSVLNELLASTISDEDLENILWRNLCRVFPSRLGVLLSGDTGAPATH